MTMEASPQVNAMLFVLTGERLLQADEDMAYDSRQPYARLGKRVRDLSDLIEKSVRDIAGSMPDEVADSYVRAMGMLIDDGGKNYLRDFGEQLDRISQGRTKASMDILESKWQVIAEVIRLLLEIALMIALSYFTGGASLTQIALAKARSRLAVLLTMSHLLERMHLLPTLSEALQEAFTTFVVRLGMITAGPDGRRPDGFDWGQIGRDAVFGAMAGGLQSIFGRMSRGLTHKFDSVFVNNPLPDVAGKFGRDVPPLGPGVNRGLPEGTSGPKTVGHHTVKETGDFAAAGGAESLAEILAGGIFYGDWSTSWSTFVGAGVSNKVEGTLLEGSYHGGNELGKLLLGPDVPRLGPDGQWHGGQYATSSTAPDAAGDDGTGTTADRPGDHRGGSPRPATASAGGAPGSPAPGGDPGDAAVSDGLTGAGRPGTEPSPEVPRDDRPAATVDGTGRPGTDTGLPPAQHREDAPAGRHSPDTVRTEQGGQPPRPQDAPPTRQATPGDSTNDLPPAQDSRDAAAPQDTAEDPPQAQDRRPAGTPDTPDPRHATPGDSPTPAQETPPAQQPPGSTAEAPPQAQDAGPPQDAAAGGGAVAPGPADGAPGPAGNDAEPAGRGGSPSTSPAVTPSVTPSGTPSPGPGTGNDTEDGLWRSVLAAPEGARQELLDQVGELRGGSRPSADEVLLRASVQDGLAGTDAVTLVMAGAPDAVQQQAGQVLLDSLARLGHAGPVTVVAPEATRESLRQTVPSALAGKVSWQDDSVRTPPPDQPEGHAFEARREGHLVLAVSDTPLDRDPGAAGAFLNTVGSDRAVVFAPHDLAEPLVAPAPLPGGPATGPERREPDALLYTRRDDAEPGVTVRELPRTVSSEQDGAFADAGVLLPLNAALTGLPVPPRTASLSAAVPDTGSPGSPADPAGPQAPVPLRTSSALPSAELPAEPAAEAAYDLRLESQAGPAAREERPDGPPSTAPATASVTAPPPATASVTAPPPATASVTAPPPATASVTAPPPATEAQPATTPAAAAATAPAPRRGRRPARLLARPARAEAGAVRTLDGRTVPDDELRKVVNSTRTGPLGARSTRTLTVSHGQEETDRDLPGHRTAMTEGTYRDVRRDSGGDRTLFAGGTRPFPAGDVREGADYFVAHGSPRTVALAPAREGAAPVRVSGVELGDLLNRWRGRSARERPLVLFSCATGHQPESAGLPVAQHVANRTGSPVYAPTTETGTARDGRGEIRAVLVTGPDGTPGQWRLFTPEPSGRRLDSLARGARLHRRRGPADPFVRAKTLQFVRTLRGTVGGRAEQAADRRRLLRGLAAVDRLRWRPRGPGTVDSRYTDARMTPELLRRLVGDRYGLPDGAEPDRGQYAGFLRDAALLLRDDSASLDALGLPAGTAAGPAPETAPEKPPEAGTEQEPPHSPEVLGALVSRDDVRGLAYAPSADVTWQLSDQPLPVAELGLNPADLNRLLERRPDLGPAEESSPAPVRSREPVALADGPDGAPRLTADGQRFRSERVAGDGDCFFASVLAGAVGQNVLPALHGMGVRELRNAVAQRTSALPDLSRTPLAVMQDPVEAVLGDVRNRLETAARAEQRRGAPGSHHEALAAWEDVAEAVRSGDAVTWRRLLRESPYPELLGIAPDPASAQQSGSAAMLRAAIEQTALWTSPFGDYVPAAFATAMDVELTVLRAGQEPLRLNEGAAGGRLYVRYNGADHYTALTSDSTPVDAPEPARPRRRRVRFADEVTGPGPESGGELPEALTAWQAAWTALDEARRAEPAAAARWDDRLADDSPATPSDAALRHAYAQFEAADAALRTGYDKALGIDPAKRRALPLETELDRHRPAELLTGPEVDAPPPPPSEIRFRDGSRLPSFTRDPAGGALLAGGVLTLRGGDAAAREIEAALPAAVRGDFDGDELRRRLRTEPASFTGPGGSRFVVGKGSGRTHEVTVEAVPYHRWERFADDPGTVTKVDLQRRAQSNVGGAKNVSRVWRIPLALSLGPPKSWLLKAGVSFGGGRKTTYSTADQGLTQTDFRSLEGSHLHVDDVYYRVGVARISADEAGGRREADASPWRRTPVRSAAFAVRGGLTWRLPDSLTTDAPRGRAPSTIVFAPNAAYRMSDTEGLYLVDSPEDTASAVFGAKPGSSAHQGLVSFLRPAALQALLPRLAGQVTGPELTRGRGHTPLGHPVLDRLENNRASLVTEATKVELRDLAQLSLQNERTQGRETRMTANVTSGPNTDFAGTGVDVRVQGGPQGRVDWGVEGSYYVGGSAARKITARVKGTPAALYRVEKTLYLRASDQPSSAARPFRVVTLDWLPESEARRLGGMDTRTPARTMPEPAPEPPAPPYLTQNHPRHLGQTRAELFTPAESLDSADGTAGDGDVLNTFLDTVLDSVERAHPELVAARWETRRPWLSRMLRGDRRARAALANARQIREELDRHTLAQSLDSLTTTGIPVGLVDPGTFRRGQLSLVLRAELTDRRYKESLSERGLRNSVSATQQIGQSRQATLALTAGAEAGISPRDHAKLPETGGPERIGNTAFGARYTRQNQHATRAGVTLQTEHLTAQTATHLYDYRVSLNASLEGHWRPRAWMRLLSAGLLGTAPFVRQLQSSPLLQDGREIVGRVELSAPAAHSSAHFAPADGAAPDDGTAAEPVSSEEAEALLDGVRRGTERTADNRDTAQVREVFSRPLAVPTVEGGRQRQRHGEAVADAATGGSWHAVAPGTPVRTALRRALDNLSVAGHLTQVTGRFGMRLTGLFASGPYRSHYIKAVLRGEVQNLRVAGEPAASSFEVTSAAERKIVGSSTRADKFALGPQAGYLHQHLDGHTPVMGNYSGTGQLTWGTTDAESTTLTASRSTTLTYTGRVYPVLGDLVETVAARDHWSAVFGLLGTRPARALRHAAERSWQGVEQLWGGSHRADRLPGPRTAAGARYRVKDGVLAHVPMLDAIETGLAPDGLGTRTPTYTSDGYRLPPFAERRRFATHGVGRLDGEQSATEVLPQLERIGVTGDGRDAVLEMLSPDSLTAQLNELTADGVTLPLQARSAAPSGLRHLPVGGRPLLATFQLTPKTTRVERVRNDYELEDYRIPGRDEQRSSASEAGKELGVGVTESQRAESGPLSFVGPGLNETGSSTESSNRTRGSGRLAMPNLATTQGHAELVTEYELTFRLVDSRGDEEIAPVTSGAGRLREMLPLSLLRADTGADGPRLPDDAPAPATALRLLEPRHTTDDAIAAWHTELPHGMTEPPDTGFLPVDVLNSRGVRDGLTLAAGHSYGAGRGHSGTLDGDATARALRAARRSPLTAPGVQPAYALDEATTQAGLTAGLRQALRPEGLRLPELASARLLGESATLDARLHARLRTEGAKLLAVENKPRMEGLKRGKETAGIDRSRSGTHDGALGAAPLLTTEPAGVNVPNAAGTAYNSSDGVLRKGALDTAQASNVKPAAARSLLFAVPVEWLGVAEVHRRVADSAAVHGARETFGAARRGRRAVESETTVLAWLREDVAADLGLITDSTFPGEVQGAWDAVAAAQAALTEADREYYRARAGARRAWLALTDAGRSEAETSSGEDGPGLAEWRHQAGQAALWEGRAEEAARQLRTLNGAAERLTAWHGLPERALPGSAAQAAPASREDTVRPAPVSFTAPEWQPKPPAPYTVSASGAPGLRTLTHPDDGTVHEVHDVPRDGAAFFHALAAAAHRHGKVLPLFGGEPPADDSQLVEGLRARLADALADPVNADLLPLVSPDVRDTFTAEEAAAAEVAFPTAAYRKEFAELGVMPHSLWLGDEQRTVLARQALGRPLTDGGKAWDHGAADLLPALAARVLGLPVTVVTGSGLSQRFAPEGASAEETLTLFVDDGHFQYALPRGTRAGTGGPTLAGAPGVLAAIPSDAAPPSDESGARPAHGTAPWQPPSSGARAREPRYLLRPDGSLTAPGSGERLVHGEPAGRGNGFFGALAQGMRHAARRPELPRRTAAALTARSGLTPGAQLRRHGLPGDAQERAALFPSEGPGEASTDGLGPDGGRLLRGRIAEARPWSSQAERAVAAWAARAWGVDLTVVREDGTYRTYPGGPEDGVPVVLRRRGDAFVAVLPELPAAPSGTPALQTGPEGEEAYELTTFADSPGTQPSPWSGDEDFDGWWNALVDSGEFPSVVDDAGWTVWGVSDSDPQMNELGALSTPLGLRGRFRADGPGAGRVSDASGALHSDRPAWDWYAPGRGRVGSSLYRSVPSPDPSGDEGPRPEPWAPDGPVDGTPPVPPTVTAADPRALAAGLPHPVKWRTDEGTLHKFSQLAPEEVFGSGLLPKGRDMVHVLDHVYNSEDVPATGYVSTSREENYLRNSMRADPFSASALARRYRWRYDVDVPGGIDVNATLGFASPFPDQREVLFPGGIEPSRIRGVQPLLNGSPAGSYRPNPAYRHGGSPTGEATPGLPPAEPAR